MKKNPSTSQEAYFAQGGAWAHDRQAALQSSKRTAWIIAGVAVAIALLEGLALLAMMPLKTVVPYTLLVDRQTGFVQALKPLDPQIISSDNALTQSFLVQYVIAREGFDRDTLQTDYRKVGSWSTSRARAEYINGMQASNPSSPLARFPSSTVVDVQVKSVTPVGGNTAMVRYDTVRRDGAGQVQPPQSWVAFIRHGYSGEPLSAAERFINPLGFQVQRYRKSQEVTPPPMVDARSASPNTPVSVIGSAIPSSSPLPLPAPRNVVP